MIATVTKAINEMKEKKLMPLWHCNLLSPSRSIQWQIRCMMNMGSSIPSSMVSISFVVWKNMPMTVIWKIPPCSAHSTSAIGTRCYHRLNRLIFCGNVSDAVRETMWRTSQCQQLRSWPISSWKRMPSFVTTNSQTSDCRWKPMASECQVASNHWQVCFISRGSPLEWAGRSINIGLSQTISRTVRIALPIGSSALYIFQRDSYGTRSSYSLFVDLPTIQWWTAQCRTDATLQWVR